MNTRLTHKQQALYEFLQRELPTMSHAPSLEQLCAILGVKSRGSLHKHIQALVAAGLVEPLQKHRGVRLRELDPSQDELPLLGRIAAGRPIEAIVDQQLIAVPPQLRTQNPCYVLEVKGDSMIDEGILDGDLVVIEQNNSARNGDIVVALIDGENVTLKRLEKTTKTIVLHPANPTLKPVSYDPQRITIQGILVGQMRSYR